MSQAEPQSITPESQGQAVDDEGCCQHVTAHRLHVHTIVQSADAVALDVVVTADDDADVDVGWRAVALRSTDTYRERGVGLVGVAV
ncbi:MAG: hypothetical protein R3E93_00865 [Thiothrix sp.]